MAPPTKPQLTGVLRCLCEDVIFVLASSHHIAEEDLAALVKRRAEAYDVVMRGGAADNDDWYRWVAAMCAATAPQQPPSWLPMRELVSALSLQAGARGMRSLFTAKPSDKEVQRARRIGALAVRSLASVLGADGELRADEQSLRASLVAALGLPDEDERLLVVEKPIPPQAIEVYGDLDPKFARLMIGGAWLAAFEDGIDPREEATVGVLAQKLGVGPDEVESLRQDARSQVEVRRPSGAASVDAVRYVLADEPEIGVRLGRIIANMALPLVYRTATLADIDSRSPAILAKRHTLERAAREACLTLAWFAALSTDPSETRYAELALRHDRVAADLGSQSEGAVARSATHEFVQVHLLAAALAAGL